MPTWTGNITSTAPVAGPAGYYYADVPNRIIAIVIDGIILGIVNAILQAIVFAVFAQQVFGITVSVSIIGLLILLALQFAVNIGYYVYMWTSMRATVGMKLLGMQIGHETDGRTIPFNQGIQRALALWGPVILGQFLFLSGGYLFSGLGSILLLVGLLLTIGWPIYLLVTTAQSPTKQGIHDRYAHTMIVKAARSVG
jgi:uncharacterized RDD family membrane protein YckC